MNTIKKENLIIEDEEEQQFIRISSDPTENIYKNTNQKNGLNNSMNSNQLSNNDNFNNSNQLNDQISLFNKSNKIKLKWSDRDEIINLFNYYNLLLETDTEFLKDDLIERNNNLILILSNLQLNLNNNIDHQSRKRFKSNNNQAIGNNYLYVLLTNEFRMEIIEKLILNLNYTIHYKDLINNYDKLNLKNENSNISSKLLHLEVDNTNLNDNNLDIESIDLNKETDNNVETDNYLNVEIGNNSIEKSDTNLNNALINSQQLDTIQSFDGQTNNKDLNRLVTYLEDKITNLQNELVNQSFKLENLNKPRPEILLTYEFEGVKNFFKKEDSWFSNYFPSNNFDWTIQIESTYDNKTRQRYLGLFLNIANSAGIRIYKMSWRCKTNFEIRLLSYTDSIHNRSTKHSYTFTKPSRPYGVGTNKFMTLSDLFDPKFGYISNNKIMIQIVLDIETVDFIKLAKDKYKKI